jgi:phosphoribosylformylglycinamidine (FGAM) synthase-like amidotransferase family enzyme
MKVLVLAGDGLNCEVETARACREVGLEPEIRAINDLIAEGVTQEMLGARYGALLIPGGFSFGDEWDSGRILALKIRSQLKWDLVDFARRGGFVLGVCNGFQCLIRLGVFGQNVSITHNSSGRFLNRWVKLEVHQGEGWLAGIRELELPIRHGEGRLVESASGLEGRVALRYTEDVNGSMEQAAGLTSVHGRILGMMPHPEAAFYRFHHPEWTQDRARAFERGPGSALFENLAKGLS